MRTTVHVQKATSSFFGKSACSNGCSGGCELAITGQCTHHSRVTHHRQCGWIAGNWAVNNYLFRIAGLTSRNHENAIACWMGALVPVMVLRWALCLGYTRAWHARFRHRLWH